MKIITCAGYYRTGSSAITDYFSEFKGCESLGICEFRFAQDPDGLASLEYNLIDNNHRHNTSHAIKRFLKYMKFENGNLLSKRYRRYFGNDFMKYTMEYIDDIVQLKCNTMWRYDKIERGELFYLIDTAFSNLYGLIKKGRRKSLLTIFKEKGYYTNISKDEFYLKTKKFTSKLLESANKNNAEFMMIDQLVPPTNVERYLNYFNEMYVIIVDRDPRDLFIMEHTKYRWGIIPQDNVEEFCKWYKITRNHRKNDKNTNNKIFIYLEDLIYDYDNTTSKLLKFVGLNEKNHINKNKYFIPEISKQGTKLWENHPELEKEIRYIEKELKDYLYKY